MNQRRQSLTQSQVQAVSIAKMLFCIVLIFVMCNVTTILSHMLEAFGGPHPNELTAASNFFVLVNSASNFVVYCFLSKNFRGVLLDFMRNCFPNCWNCNWRERSNCNGGGGAKNSKRPDRNRTFHTEVFNLTSTSNASSLNRTNLAATSNIPNS